MKIVVAAMGQTVAEHFGHCLNFICYETAQEEIIKEENIPNPGHKPGFLPNFLAERGAEVLITGGIGAGAVEIFQARGVKVICGATGDAKENVLKFLKGELYAGANSCPGPQK